MDATQHERTNEQTRSGTAPPDAPGSKRRSRSTGCSSRSRTCSSRPSPRDSAQRVLDVGCGTGSTTLAVARRLGANGAAVGIDISEPMIAARAGARRARRARRRASSAPTRRRHAFEPASFDMIVSRFGVMFFDDSVRAFANLRRAASDGAELHVIAWRSAAENPFMTTAERAAAPLLPDMPARRPDAPGQFAFADREPRPLDPGGERLGRDRHPADRRRLHAARGRAGPLPHAARPARPSAARGRRADARAGHRNGPRRVRALRARRGSPLHGRVLDGRRTSTGVSGSEVEPHSEPIGAPHRVVEDAVDSTGTACRERRVFVPDVVHRHPDLGLRAAEVEVV